jgi:DNA invertase Pin-like site-specific DNA recombinase
MREIAGDRKVFGYARVSSDKQEDGFSLEAQVRDIIACCAATGLGEPFVVLEVASAGKPVLAVALPGTKTAEPVASPRPLLLLLLSRLMDLGAGGHLVVWKLDRLSRVSTEQELMLDMLRRPGVQAHSTVPSEQQVLDNGDANDPGRTFTRQILAAAAQYERALIHYRMQTGLRTKAAKGGWVGGRVPFGYTAEAGELVIDAGDADVVRRIFFWRKQQSRSAQWIADNLNLVGHSGWYKMRVHRVLANEDLYLGTYTDPYGQAHPRQDLRILPTDWHDYAETQG